MILKSLQKAYDGAIKKGWNKIYIAVDIHDTIVVGNYKLDELPKNYIGKSKECLQYLTERSDVTLILYTCSHPVEIDKYIEYFKLHGIDFEHVNWNPEVPNNALGCYTDKFYFNILLDDKSGFEPEHEWDIIHDFFSNKPILK
jgi:hypothetical protein